jgi:hypothetical protein
MKTVRSAEKITEEDIHLYNIKFKISAKKWLTNRKAVL